MVLARGARSKALRNLQTTEDLGEASRCVRMFISEKSCLPSTSATTSETLHLARVAGADPELLHELEGFLRRSERAGYAREEGLNMDGRDEAIRLIGRLETCRWKTTSEDMTEKMPGKTEVLS
jgi:hypothetical protein